MSQVLEYLRRNTMRICNDIVNIEIQNACVNMKRNAIREMLQ